MFGARYCSCLAFHYNKYELFLKYLVNQNYMLIGISGSICVFECLVHLYRHLEVSLIRFCFQMLPSSLLVGSRMVPNEHGYYRTKYIYRYTLQVEHQLLVGRNLQISCLY